MEVESNTVAAIRAAMEQAEQLQRALDAIDFFDPHFERRLQTSMEQIESGLKTKLFAAEWPLKVNAGLVK